MSNRQSGGANTLFNYFNKLPNQKNGSKNSSVDDNLNKENRSNVQEKRQLNSPNEEDCDIVPASKRRRRIIEDSDEDEANESINDIKSKFGFKASKRSESPAPNKTPKKPKQTKLTNKDDSYTPTTPKKSKQIKTEDSNLDDEQTWTHCKLDFLKPDRIRDRNGKRPTDPDYDPRTLYVPSDFIAKQTPAMQQWWTLKRDHFDCVLFFKVGKFYELYHMDAVTGVNELGFSYMRGEFAHSGFPESAYGRMVNTLVELGYKVARVEQTETPEAMSKRLQSTPKGTKQSKVVSREICQITNKGTQVQGLQDLDFKQPMSSYLLAIYENKSNNYIEFGVCLVDSSIGTFYLGQFRDDNRYSRLLTMLAQYPPAVILEERKQLSSETKYILKTATGSASIESLTSETQFMSSTKTLRQLQENEYFGNINDEKIDYPATLQNMISEDDPLKLTCKVEYDLAIKCLGACLWYLKDCFLDIQLFSLGKFELYVPPDMSTAKAKSNKFMILDSSAMSGLHILGPGSTLQHTLDQCCTAMGKRLLHQWICKPVCNIDEIRGRQDAISELVQRQDLLNEARAILKSLPDLERLICRIHCMGNSKRAKKHPDSRAILYEEKTYSSKKIRDFMLTLNGFEKAVNLADIFSSFESTMLQRYAGSAGGLFPDIMDTIVHFKNSFNAAEAEKEGKIIPQKGVDAEYDASIDEIKDIENDLDEYLKSQCKYFKCTVNYFGSDKKRYQLDVPESATHRAGNNYSLEGTKKGSKPSKRYTTPESKALLARMMAAEAKNREILHDINRRILEKFSQKYDEWCLVCHCLSVLDVLCSLGQYTINQSVTMCVPQILPFDSTPLMIIRDGVHPFIPNIETFVPNDTELGTDNHSNTLILTGPNMGGKSTLMRQVALLTIMAQLGCHVPASEMKFTLVDRIFTRLGAHDDIITGSSTFLVELKEASAILQHSTPHSLVFLDELGRGTATYDGTAIAIAYVDRLIRINCRTIFSTHYYSLLDYFKNNDLIQLGHMACKVESEGDDVDKETVIFMYKMVAGPCPKSYGFNAARLAGIPRSVISRARLVSQKLEKQTVARKLFRKLLCDGQYARELLNAITV